MPEKLSASEPSVICITIDVEWAAPQILADLVALLDERRLPATFFCTHAGIDLPGHERAIHPNFRHNGDAVRQLRRARAAEFDALAPAEIYSHVVQGIRALYPEAVGVRAHSLIYDSELLAIYHRAGFSYESNYLLPLVAGIRPVWKEFDMLEIPIFFNDHFELKTGATGFQIEALHLEQRGLKVVQFHPNMLFINAASNEQYLRSKPFYHDYGRLLEMRHRGRGARTFFIELLDTLAAGRHPVMTLADVNRQWRDHHPFIPATSAARTS
jgi:peptidoglycan/xylan/chitin deacetylase (PgdA/CDA1 family)